MDVIVHDSQGHHHKTRDDVQRLLWNHIKDSPRERFKQLVNLVTKWPNGARKQLSGRKLASVLQSHPQVLHNTTVVLEQDALDLAVLQIQHGGLPVMNRLASALVHRPDLLRTILREHPEIVFSTLSSHELPSLSTEILLAFGDSEELGAEDLCSILSAVVTKRDLYAALVSNTRVALS
jgi:hypothetical protein